MSKKINLEIKVVVVGAEDSGKTSLISKYVSGETPQNPSRTLASERSAKVLNNEKHRVIFEIIDTPGCERLVEMVLCSCSDADYSLVCYDLSNPNAWTRARDWIRNIRSRSSCRIILCGTKKDILQNAENQRAVRETIINTYADGLQMDYFEISSKYSEGIDELFAFLISDFIKTTQNAIKVATLKREYENLDNSHEPEHDESVLKKFISCQSCSLL